MKVIRRMYCPSTNLWDENTTIGTEVERKGSPGRTPDSFPKSLSSPLKDVGMTRTDRGYPTHPGSNEVTLQDSGLVFDGP